MAHRLEFSRASACRNVPVWNYYPTHGRRYTICKPAYGIRKDATKNAITTVEGNILKTHLEECIKESLNGTIDADQKIEEIVKVLKR